MREMEMESDPLPVMPFGKHKGEEIAEIPSDYLNWLLDNCELRDWLEDAVAEELEARGE